MYINITLKRVSNMNDTSINDLPYDSRDPLIECPLYYSIINKDEKEESEDKTIYTIMYYSIHYRSDGNDRLDSRDIKHMEFRYIHRDVYNIKISDEHLQMMFENFIDNQFRTDVFIMIDYIPLFCHITPVKMKNYLNIDRKIAEDILTKSSDKIQWLIRPSSIVCKEYGRDNLGNMYPLTESYVVSYRHSINGISHVLFNKTLAGIYSISQRETYYNNFGELLQFIIDSIKRVTDIRRYDTSVYYKT